MTMATSDSDLTDLSSELSSVRSLSPPPTFGYPSPQSSQDHGCSDYGIQKNSRKRSVDPSEVPPAKKRKSVETKPRTTVHLDLRSHSNTYATDQAPQLNLLLKTLRKRRKIVVIAGAGISTSAGVPDFRSSNGLFNTLKNDNKAKASGKHLFDASVYQTDDSTSSFHDMVRTLSRLVRTAKPTKFHEMLATLASDGRLMRLYTQNVDGIDTSLKPLKTKVPLVNRGPWPRTIQLHGSLDQMVCSKCNFLSPFDASLFDGPLPPPCNECVAQDDVRTNVAGKRSHGIGRLRPRMVLYNENNPDDEAIGNVVKADLRARPDAVIVVGTSLEIPGVRRIVREMCGVVRSRKDGVAVWINRGPPPTSKEFEDCWDLVVAGDCDTVANQANMRQWDDEGRDHTGCTESEAERVKVEKEKVVQVKIKSKNIEDSDRREIVTPKKSNTPAMMTPAESPMSKATKLPKSFSFLPPLKLSDSSIKISNAKPTGKKANQKRTNGPLPKGKVSSQGSKASRTMKINSTFKVIKAPVTSHPATNLLTPKKKTAITEVKTKPRNSPTTKEKAIRLLASINEPPPVMAPLSPSSARSNGASPSRDDRSFLKLEKVEVPLKLEVPPSVEIYQPEDRLKRMSEEIVSPIGSTPSNMGSLLN